MTELLSDLETPSDAELISRVRGGDVAAYGELFSRHQEAAHRLARQLVRGHDSDDLVSEAFAKVLSVLQGGGGPDVAFRAYLLTAVRRLHVDRVRSAQRLQTTDDLTPFDPGVPFQDTAVAGFESGAAAKAFASLPERWQLVLWHLEVEGQKPADIAPLLGMSANSVSALAYRAREGLRQAFLTMHISDLTETDCRWVNEHLGAFIRKGLSKRDTGKVQSHLDECRRCTAMYLELNEVNSNLAGIIAPLLLGAAASGYVASGGAGAGVLGLLSKVKELVAGNTGAVTAAGVAAGVAAAAAVAVVTLGGGPGHKDPVLTDPAASARTPAAAAPGLPTGKASRSAGTTPGASPTASPAAVLAPTVTLTPTDVPGGAASGSPSAADSSTTDPASPTSTVDLSGTTIDDTGVHLVALGSPSLPATLTVRLGSDPSGVVFGASPDCTVAVDGASAVCNTVTGGSGARVPGAARTVASTSYTAELPFDTDRGPESADVSVSVDLPDGYQVSGGTGGISRHRYTRPVQVRRVDAALDLSPTPVRPGTDDRYSVTGHLKVSGPSATALTGVTYTVHGARFAESGARTTTRPATDGSPAFTLVPDDVSRPAVTVSVAVPAPFDDVDGSNDTATAPLQPYDIRLSDLATSSATADADGDQQLTATLDDDGLDGITYSLSSDDAGDRITSVTPVGHTVVLTVRSASASPHPVSVTAHLPAGYTDADPSDNATGPVSWTPAPPPSDRDVDVAVTALAPGDARPGPDDTYTLTALVSVDGPGAADLPGVSYTIEGGSFVAAGDCEATLCTKTATGSPSFMVVPENPAAPKTVSITAVVPAGFHDTQIDNNTATAALRRYDVSLTGLTAAAGTADAQGDQQFTATVDDDGLDGIIYSLGSDDPADEITTVSRVGDAVTFTIRSGSSSSHPVSVTADLPAGYTDADASDNTRTATWTALPRDVDVSMRSTLTPETARPRADDRYELSAAVSVNGPAGSRVQEITYTVTGAQFVDGAGTTSTVTRPASESSPTFVITHEGGSTVQITADARGFTETAPVDNSARATLRPYDVGLTDLRATTPTADADGNQTFSATLDRDGFTGPLDFRVTDKPTGATTSVPTESGDGRVTFTVTSRDGGDVNLRVDLPSGYTDADPSDNAAPQAASFVPKPAPQADLKLSLVPDITGNAGKGSAAVAVSGGPADAAVRLVVGFDADQVTVSVPAGCTATTGRIVCTSTGATVPERKFDIALTDRPDQHGTTTTVTFDVSADGYDETNAADNHGSVALTRSGGAG